MLEVLGEAENGQIPEEILVCGRFGGILVWRQISEEILVLRLCRLMCGKAVAFRSFAIYLGLRPRRFGA